MCTFTCLALNTSYAFSICHLYVCGCVRSSSGIQTARELQGVKGHNVSAVLSPPTLSCSLFREVRKQDAELSNRAK